MFLLPNTCRRAEQGNGRWLNLKRFVARIARPNNCAATPGAFIWEPHLCPFPIMSRQQSCLALCYGFHTRERQAQFPKHARKFDSHRSIGRRTNTESLQSWHPPSSHFTITTVAERLFSFHSFVIFGWNFGRAIKSTYRSLLIVVHYMQYVGLDPCLKVK